MTNPAWDSLTPAQQQAAWAEFEGRPVKPKRSRAGLVAAELGALGLLLWLVIPFSVLVVVPSISAIVVGAKAKQRSNNAMLGIVLGVVNIVVLIVAAVVA